MKIDYNELNLNTYMEHTFFDYFLELIAENFALGKFKGFDEINVKELCYNLYKINPYKNSWYYISFSKKNVNSLAEVFSAALKKVATVYSVEYFVRHFYFEKMSMIFKMQPKTELSCDENGLPIEAPLVLRNYITNLFSEFSSISSLETERTFVENPPIEFLVKMQNKVRWKLPIALKNIVLDKFHKGINLFAFFFYQIPKYERITQSLLFPKPFLRLCNAEWNKIILLEDDVNSIDFKLAVLDLIPFIDSNNKMLFDNRAVQYKHNYVANIIENALLAEIEKKYY